MYIKKYMYLAMLGISCITSSALAGEKFDDKATAQLHELARTGLELDATRGMKPRIQELITAGADINAINQYDRTPVQEAIFRANPIIALYLVELGADISKMGTGTQNMSTKEFAYFLNDTLTEEAYKAAYNELMAKLAEVTSKQ